jgi:hypothetical protein
MDSTTDKTEMSDAELRESLRKADLLREDAEADTG